MALYLFFASAVVVIAGRLAGLHVMPFFCLNIITGTAVLYYYYYQSSARKWSRELGLKHVVLLPVHYRWAMAIISISGGKIAGRGRRAFEVHIDVPAGLSLHKFLKTLDGDLNLAKSKLPDTLFFWETTAPVPSSIRGLIREKAKDGHAFWKPGGWAIPRFPFTGRDMKKGVLRRGAILIQKEGLRE